MTAIQRLQNDVRRAINFFPPGEKNCREGVDSSQLKKRIAEVVGPPRATSITLRKLRATPLNEPEYALSYDGELVFRLVYVPWPSEYRGREGRWHVRRHPEATWWRTRGKRRQRPA